MTATKNSVEDKVEQPLWTAWVLSLFPEMFPGPLGFSLAGRALEKGIWRLNSVNIRDYATDRHKTVDDTPMGGGPGMVLRPDVVGPALDDVISRAQRDFADSGLDVDPRVVYLSPRGRRFDQAAAKAYAEAPGLVLLCGRFEGLDQRVLDARNVEEVSLGDFVLSGGELPALTLMDAVIRLLPGVIGDPAALEEESFARDLLEYPQYTRPKEWEGRMVPEVLTSGHHENVRKWRLAQAEELTKARRPDLWARYRDGIKD
jgi:tRNA (guanine37-N1)-methyltransferase